jgi:uncharacterized protein (TIGR00255 family)
MLVSMTGFGRATSDIALGKLVVEIQSVNRKYLEISITLPREFSRFEPDVRKWVSYLVSRGAVNVKVTLIPAPNAILSLLPDIELLKVMKKAWEKIAKEIGTDVSTIDLPFLLQNLPSQQKVDLSKDEDLADLQRVVDQALQGFVGMKQTEGKALSDDLQARLKDLAHLLEGIETLAAGSTEKMREKLFEKMKEVLEFSSEMQERLLREVALFAEKIDIAEEITRFRSHLSQFHSLLSSNEGKMGRKMEFLLQEMGREVNTIGSKSVDSKISHLVVEMKSELEKMREQIQNIE